MQAKRWIWLLVALFGAAGSCVLNPQPDPPADGRRGSSPTAADRDPSESESDAGSPPGIVIPVDASADEAEDVDAADAAMDADATDAPDADGGHLDADDAAADGS
jgi:hypothetical protein